MTQSEGAQAPLMREGESPAVATPQQHKGGKGGSQKLSPFFVQYAVLLFPIFLV